MNNETDLQMRLRRAKEALAVLRERESQARRDLKSAEDARKEAKDRYDSLFIEEENAEVARRKSAYNRQA